jgi:hypothetical protein
MVFIWCWLCVLSFSYGFSYTLVQLCWSFAYAPTPQVKGDGGEKVGKEAMAAKIAEFQDYEEDGGVTMQHLGQITPYRFLMSAAELELAMKWANQALGTSSDDAECTALVAQDSADMGSDKSEQGTSSSVMSFFG